MQYLCDLLPQQFSLIKIHVWIKFSGFQVNVVTPENYIKCDSGLIYRDFEVGKGDCPKDGQQVLLSLSLMAMV